MIAGSSFDAASHGAALWPCLGMTIRWPPRYGAPTEEVTIFDLIQRRVIVQEFPPVGHVRRREDGLNETIFKDFGEDPEDFMDSIADT